MAATAALVDRLGTPAGPGAILGVLSLVGLGSLALVRVGLNLPVSVPASGAYPAALVLATLAPAVGLLGVGLASDQVGYRVGLTFAGVFGVLSLLAEPASLPATLAIAGAIALVTGDRLRESKAEGRFDRGAVAGVLGVGAVLSLAAGIGIEPVALRPLGSKIVLLGVAGSPVFAEWDVESIAVGLGVGVAVLAVGTTAPFVTGAMSLVVGGVVGASLPLLFVAAVGAVSLFWASARAGQWTLALAATVLLVAGIPATIPRALGFVGAITLLGGGKP